MQSIGLMLRSKLVILSVTGSVVLLGGAGYIAAREIAIINQSKAPISGTSVKPSSAVANGKAVGAKTASTSTTPANSKPATSSPVKSSSTTTASVKTTVTTGPSVSNTSTNQTTPAAPPATTTTPASNGSCFSSPSSCGYPDASNTGPVAGTVFTKVPEQATSGNGWSWDSTNQYLSVYGSNVTLNGIDTWGNIDVTGSNVTIQNCKISENNGTFGVSLRHTTNVTVKNCDIAGTDASAGRLLVAIKSIYGDDVNPQSIANNIWYVSTGIQYCQGLIKDNYIHDLGYQSGDHLNGMTSNSGCSELTVQHNTIFNSFDQTDAISLFEDFGQQMNALVTNNYVAGGGYSIYGGANSGGVVPTNIQITNNRVSDYYYPNGGYYGWMAAWDGSGSGNVCSGNILEHTATGKTEPISC